MSYHHFSKSDRARIEQLLSLGFSHRHIAQKVNRHHSSISREIKRNATSLQYLEDDAQKAAQSKRNSSRPKGKKTVELLSLITDKLLATWSPEQIANTVTLGIVSFKTIYNWIYSGTLPNITTTNLRQKGKRKKTQKRGKFSMGTPICERDQEVQSREAFGHWELDSMVSSRGDSKGCLATFLERKSRIYTAFKIKDRSSEAMREAITKLYNILPKGTFKTATTDRGKEFACYSKIKELLGLPLYFADAYAPWQRGSNENSNGLLREFYPKKTDLSLVKQEDLTHSLFLINSRPRKCLGWKSAIQVFLHEVSHLN